MPTFDVRFKMKLIPSYEEVCRESWMTGSLRITKSEESVILNKKTNILFLIVWCALIMGGVSYAVFNYVEDSTFSLLFIIISIVISAVFIGVALFQNRKPSILIFDRSSGMLSLPRRNGFEVNANEVDLWIVPSWVYRHNDRERHLSQVLTIYIRNSETEVPVFCELSNILKKRVQMFSDLINVDFRVQDLRTIHAYKIANKTQ